MRRVLLPALGIVVAVIGVMADREPSRVLSDTFVNWAKHPTIRYRETDTTDPVAQLNRRIQSGETRLRGDAGDSGYLRSVLDQLHVPIESQMLVFEPDSVQAARISRDNPRSLFFNDNVVVGWVRGGFIELASQDPTQGAIFYSHSSNQSAGAPSFVRRNDCLTCHFNRGTIGVPGMLDRSFLQYGVTHRVPLGKRWGGWYVTGQTAGHHLGNGDIAHLFDTPPPAGTLNWPSLSGKFDTTGYLTTQSDVVALLVFDHQMQMMNLLTRIGWETRVMQFRQGKSEGQLLSAGDDPSDHSISLDDAAREVVDYMLFVEEAPLPGPIRGATNFATEFAGEGPHDHKGRSLRQFDLRTRLFTYPCSYMIYSAQFEQLPRVARAAIYRRMWQVLSGADSDPAYARLTRTDRAAIVDILRDTKSDLPSYFTSPRPRAPRGRPAVSAPLVSSQR